MKFFIDTANVNDIRKANDMGVICGVTTNPSLIAKEGRDFNEVIKEITSIVDSGFCLCWYFDRNGKCCTCIHDDGEYEQTQPNYCKHLFNRWNGNPWSSSGIYSCK